MMYVCGGADIIGGAVQLLFCLVVRHCTADNCDMSRLELASHSRQFDNCGSFGSLSPDSCQSSGENSFPPTSLSHYHPDQ